MTNLSKLNDDFVDQAALGNVEVVKLLLEAGADVHARGDDALRWASYYGHTEVVKLLLEAGADVHAKDDEALRGASRYGHTEVVNLLLEHYQRNSLKIPKWFKNNSTSVRAERA